MDRFSRRFRRLNSQHVVVEAALKALLGRIQSKSDVIINIIGNSVLFSRERLEQAHRVGGHFDALVLAVLEIIPLRRVE